MLTVMVFLIVVARVEVNSDSVCRNLAIWCKNGNSRKNAAFYDERTAVLGFSDRSLLGCNEFVSKIQY
jgi:hypothetical protein